MDEGVSIAWRAARIRSRFIGETVPMNLEKQEGTSLPLDPSPNH